eukprot:gene9432-4064_t
MSPDDDRGADGMNGYELSKCLRAARKAREEAEEASGDAEDERARIKQFEQPGTLVTLPSGIQYREIETGTGPEAVTGSQCSISYIVYRLASGAYFKYASGGTPVFLWSLGFGQEGKDDLGDVYRFTLGALNSLPRAATPAVVGMRPGGRRRILIPPQYGWVNDESAAYVKPLYSLPAPPGSRKLLGEPNPVEMK